jgi:hypothetical protein
MTGLVGSRDYTTEARDSQAQNTAHFAFAIYHFLFTFVVRAAVLSDEVKKPGRVPCSLP